MEFTLLFKGDTPSICERAAKKKKLIEKKKKENFYLPWVVHQAILPNAHTSLTEIITPYLDSGIPIVP